MIQKYLAIAGAFALSILGLFYYKQKSDHLNEDNKRLNGDLNSINEQIDSDIQRREETDEALQKAKDSVATPESINDILRDNG